MDDLNFIAALRDSVAEVLASECGREAVLQHTARETGPLMPLWEAATELGWMGLLIDEAYGGLGLGLDAIVPVYEEMGKMAAPMPFLTTMLTADAIQRCASADQKAEWLPKIISGQIATLSAPLLVAEPTITAHFEGTSIILSGTATHLLDARDAAIILLLGQATDGTLYRVIATPEDQLHLENATLWDHGHTLSAATLNRASLPVSRSFAVDAAAEEAVLNHAMLGLAAEAVGGSEGILAMTIEYLKTRVQFGKPIGAFQALKHRVANHQANTVAARALLRSATRLATANAPDAAQEASAAKALACTYYVETARDSIQLHGGMGFTAEHACHLYLKRAQLIAHLFGDETLHNARSVQSIFNAKAV